MGDIVRIQSSRRAVQICCFQVDNGNENILLTLAVEATSNIQRSQEIVGGGKEHGRLSIVGVEVH